MGEQGRANSTGGATSSTKIRIDRGTVMRLREIAHARTGDKGDTCQISVIAFDPADFELLTQVLTTERILAHLPRLPVRSIRRFELPQLGALNFILEGALGGGVTRSLSLDAHGKTLGAQILDIEIDETGESGRP